MKWEKMKIYKGIKKESNKGYFSWWRRGYG